MSGRNNPAPDIPRPVIPCSELRIDAVLVNVNVTMAAKVAVAGRYPVGLIDGSYPAPLVDEIPLGSIASGALSRLVECLRANEAFDAEVTELQGAYVRVLVTHR